MTNIDRNLEAISAYLDGELTGKDRERLELQLQNDASLQKLLEELKRTRSVLRSTPIIRAPRNFLLTPEMVGQKENRNRAFPVLRFASAFAAFLLVLLFLGDLFVIPDPIFAPARTVQLEAEVPMIEAEEFAGESPAPPAEPLMQAVPVEEPAAEEAESAADANVSSLLDKAPEMEKIIPTQIPVPVGEDEGMLAGGLSTAVVTEVEDEPAAAREFTEIPSWPGSSLRIYVRVAEYSLLFIAITTGIAAYYIFRRNR